MITRNYYIELALTLAVFLVIGLLIYAVVSSNAYYYNCSINIIYIIISIIICACLLVFYATGNYSSTLKIFFIVSLTLVILSLIYAIIQLASPKCRKYIFYVEWTKVAREYTHQRLFRKPSASWKAKKGSVGSWKAKKKGMPDVNELAEIDNSK